MQPTLEPVFNLKYTPNNQCNLQEEDFTPMHIRQENEVAIIKRKSPFTGIIHERAVNVDPKAINEWLRRWEAKDTTVPHIQDAFPNLSPEDREYILTGITPEEWALWEFNSEREIDGLSAISDPSEMGKEYVQQRYDIDLAPCEEQLIAPERKMVAKKRWWYWW